jgi:hypothetical protein
MLDLSCEHLSFAAALSPPIAFGSQYPPLGHQQPCLNNPRFEYTAPSCLNKRPAALHTYNTAQLRNLSNVHLLYCLL